MAKIAKGVPFEQAKATEVERHINYKTDIAIKSPYIDASQHSAQRTRFVGSIREGVRSNKTNCESKYSSRINM